MRTNRRAATPVLFILFIALALSSCGGGTNETTPTTTGNVTVALTDAPSYAFDNVWVTVRRVWFHQLVDAPFSDTATGWVRFDLASGVTVNLAALSGDNTALTVFDNLSIATGTYRQMLLFLEPTENALTPSAATAGLRFNNQVDNGALHAALRVPNAAQGIRIAGPFVIAKGALLRLAVDFNVGRDVLPFNRGAVREFLLQPRPAAFDLDNAGAIVGFIDNAAARDNAALFEVFAEQVPAGQAARVVRRAAAVDNATGRFVLYPLTPGSLPGERYDIVIRGIGRRTAIITNVPVNGATTPASNPTILGAAASPIAMDCAALPDYRIAATISGTSGAMADFFQDVSGSGYVVRQVNFDPLTGTIKDLSLADGQVGKAQFISSGGAINLSLTTPDGGTGTYRLVAEAPLFNSSALPGGGTPVSNPTSVFSPPSITGLTPNAPAGTPVGVTASGVSGVGPMDNVVIFATFGGTILNALSLGPVGDPPTINNAISNLPGGTAGATFSMASYGVSAYGWRTSVDNTLRIGSPVALARPQSGAASVSFTIQKVTLP